MWLQRACVVVVVAACLRGHACVFLIDMAGSVIERVKLQGPPAQGLLFALGCVALCSFWRENVPPADCVARSSRSAPTFRLSTEVAHAFVFPPFLSRCNSFPFTSMLAATLPFSPFTHARCALQAEAGAVCTSPGAGAASAVASGAGVLRVCRCSCVGACSSRVGTCSLRRGCCIEPSSFVFF